MSKLKKRYSNEDRAKVYLSTAKWLSAEVDMSFICEGIMHSLKIPEDEDFETLDICNSFPEFKLFSPDTPNNEIYNGAWWGGGQDSEQEDENGYYYLPNNKAHNNIRVLALLFMYQMTKS